MLIVEKLENSKGFQKVLSFFVKRANPNLKVLN